MIYSFNKRKLRSTNGGASVVNASTWAITMTTKKFALEELCAVALIELLSSTFARSTVSVHAERTCRKNIQ